MRYRNFLRQAGLSLVLALFFATAVLAQAPASPPPASPKDEAVKQMRALRNDPPKYLEAIISFLTTFPDSNEAESGAYYLRDIVKRAGNDPASTRTFVARFVEGTKTLPDYMRVRFYAQCITIYFTNGLAAEASDLALKTIPLLDEKAYVEWERQKYVRYDLEVKKRNPAGKGREFVAAEHAERYQSFAASVYASLGNAFLKQEKLDDASKAFRESYKIKPETDAALGIADIAERQGKINEAFEFMTFAMLSGRLKPEKITRYNALYDKVKKNKNETVEAYLDKLYRSRDRNPLKPAKYQPVAGRTNRVALAELFTGAGCIPCIPVDYSFDTLLKEYPRQDVALLVYHMHAPNNDPLTNHSTESRNKYYDVNSAPTIILDGQKFQNEVDPRTVDLAVTRAKVVYDALKAKLNEELGKTALAKLDLKATRTGSIIKATVNASQVAQELSDVTLQIALVEEEVSYSGENGLRFHPMVLRNFARRTKEQPFGFAIDTSKLNTIEYAFDLDKITEENLRYYDDYPVERRQELSARLDKETLDSFNFSMREKKNVMDREKLVVVAFLQDNKTKQILQAVFEKVNSPAP